MRYIRSSGAHRQFAPQKSRWQKWKENREKSQIIKDERQEMNRRSRYDNPFTTPAHPKRLKIILIISGAMILIVTWLGVLIFLPFFQVTKFEYLGLNIIRQKEIEENIRVNFLAKKGIFPSTSYFLFRPAKLEKFLNDNYSLDSVVVSKFFPNKVRVDISEKVSSVIYDDGQAYTLLDRWGKSLKVLSAVTEEEIISPLTTVSGTPTLDPATTTVSPFVHIPNYRYIAENFGNYPIVYDMRSSSHELNTNFLPEDIIAGAINFKTMAEKQGIAKIKYYRLESIQSGLEVKTDHNWDLFVSPQNDIQAQISNLKSLLRSNAKPTSYIDLRYGERVFWK